MEKLKNIIRNNRMSTRPEYFSGRGATTSDLNSDILFGIHKGIQKDFGDKAAKSFVEMVADLKIASATTFLNELYRLFNNNWEHISNHAQDKAGIEVPKNENGEYDENSALMGQIGIMNHMHMGSQHDDTNRIVSHFLSSNGIKQDTIHYDSWGVHNNRV